MSKYRKALFAALTAAGGALATALTDFAVSNDEWGGIVAAAVVAGIAVWRVPNASSASGRPVQRSPFRG